MSNRTNKLSNLSKLLIFGVLAGLVFYMGFGSKLTETFNPTQVTNSKFDALDASATNASPSLNLSSIQAVSAEQVIQFFPESNTQPMIVAFKSKYCHDCQQLAPVLHTLIKKNPTVALKTIDVQYEKEQYGHVLHAFRPTVVPVTVFIAPGGRVIQDISGYQTEETLAPLLNPILPTT